MRSQRLIGIIMFSNDSWMMSPEYRKENKGDWTAIALSRVRPAILDHTIEVRRGEPAIAALDSSKNGLFWCDRGVLHPLFSEDFEFR